MKQVFQALREANLIMKPKKCEFAKQELRFLGHIISKDEIRVDPEKIVKMVSLPLPTNLKQLQFRLGLFLFYRKYIKGFSKITRLMYELTRKDNGTLVPFEWTDQRQKAFDKIKKKMTTISVIAHLDFNKPFILYTDASGGDVRAVLHQKGNDEREKLIACASRAFNKHEKKYPIIE